MTSYSDDSAVGVVDSDTALERQKNAAYKTLKNLKSEYRHHRFRTYKARLNFLKRIRAAETKYHAILSELTALQHNSKYQLYKKLTHRKSSALTVTVQISLDGLVYSNPAPKVNNSQHIWVRCVIDEAHHGEIGIPKQHEIVHLTWSYYKLFTKLDTIGSAGHDEYFVSNPLTITREFTAPSAGSTKKNFIVYVDLYERLP